MNCALRNRQTVVLSLPLDVQDAELATDGAPGSVLLVAFDVTTEQTLKVALRESNRQPSA